MFKELGEFVDNAGRKTRNVLHDVLEDDGLEVMMGYLSDELEKLLLEDDDLDMVGNSLEKKIDKINH